MPLYEYLCESCGRRFEAIQSHSEAPFTTCNRCGGTLKKLLSAPAFQFKGTGWYVSDYGRSGGQTGSPEKDKTDSSASKESSSKEGPSKESSSKEAASKDGTSKESASKDGASKKSGRAPSAGKDS